MIGDDDQPTTPPPSPHPPPPPPIAPSPSPLGLGRRLLGSIRALSSAIALPSPTTPAAAASASPRRGLSLLLHLKPDLQLHDPPPPSSSTPASASHQDQDQDQDQDHEQAEDAAAPAPTHAPKAKRALLLPQPPTPSQCSSLAPSAPVAVDHHQEQEEPCGLLLLDEAALNLHTQGAPAAADDPGPTKGLHVLEQHKGDLPLTEQATLLSIQDHVAAGDGDDHHLHRDEQQQRTSVVDHNQLKVDAAIDDDQLKVPDATARPSPTDDAIAVAAQEQDHELATHGLGMGSTDDNDAVEGQEVVEQGVVVRVGQGTQDANAASVGDDQEEKPLLEQRTSTSCEELLGTAMENDGAKGDQEEVEQGVIGQGDATIDDDNAVKGHEVVGQSVIDDAIAVDGDDQEKKPLLEQCTSTSCEEELGTAMENDDDTVQVQEVVEQGVVYLTTMDDDASVKEQEVVEQGFVYLTMYDDSVKDHEVLQQGIIGGTDDIAVKKQDKVLEQCSRATKDEHTVKEMEMVVEQGVIDPKYMDLATEDQDKLSIINDQGTVPMDDIVVQDHDKAVVQYASDAIGTIKDESPVEEHDTVGNQDVLDKNGRIKDDIDVEEHGYVKEQVIIDKWGTSSDATALEGQKNEAELCIGDEQIAGKDMDGVHAEGNMLEQRTGDKQGATLSDFTVDKHKDVVERDRHEWGAPEDDLAMDTTAYQATRDWGIVNKEKVKLPEDDRAMDTAAYQGTGDWGIISKEKYRMPARRYPQKPRKLNCPSYMSKGTCTYGPSCHFNHPPQFNAKTNDSWRPSERRNHGAAEILELNRLGLPIREGARNCDYYMRTGACRYGKNCHFNHPDHVIDARFSSPTGWEDNVLQTEKSSDNALTETSHMKKSSYDATLNDRSHLKKSSDDATLDDRSHLKKSSDDATLDDRSHLKKSSDGATVDDTSYSKKSSYHDTSSTSGVLPPSIFRMLLPPQKVLLSTEGKAKKKSDWSSASDDSDGCCSADSSDGPLCKQEEHADYPERPGRQECPFLARYDDCKFASACKYHHPKQSKDKEQVNYPERRSVTTDDHHPSTRISPEVLPQQPQYPERPGQPDCRYYMQFGKCKYLSACIFHHPKDRLAAMWNPSDPAHSDQIGPEIHGMPDCSFYMKSGKCQFGSLCEFRHPKDTYSTTEEAFGERTGSGAYDSLTRSDNGVEQQEGSIMYPERPGEPECAHYMRQGYCKFQMNCKYHHPGDRLSKKPYYDSTCY